MITTQSPITNVKLVLAGGPLLAQVAAPLGNSKYRVGKLAYDFLGVTLQKSAAHIHDTAALLGLNSIAKRDLQVETEAALAMSAAAILDCTKGRRLTVTEQLEHARDYLDDELAAGW